ncbi:hypothetical protein GCM10022243_65890 [Saccharothrix violaceirubra]
MSESTPVPPVTPLKAERHTPDGLPPAPARPTGNTPHTDMTWPPAVCQCPTPPDLSFCPACRAAVPPRPIPTWNPPTWSPTAETVRENHLRKPTAQPSAESDPPEQQ